MQGPLNEKSTRKSGELIQNIMLPVVSFIPTSVGEIFSLRNSSVVLMICCVFPVVHLAVSGDSGCGTVL